MVRTNQGGSILGFVIIGAVMALLLLGGVYFVRHNLASLIGQTSGTTEEDPNPNPSNEEEEKPEEEETVTEEEGETGNEESGEQAGQPQENGFTPQTPPADVPTENLPEAGPGEMLVASLLVSSVVGALAAYLRSRSLPTSL